jgi:hypothetical protein
MPGSSPCQLVNFTIDLTSFLTIATGFHSLAWKEAWGWSVTGTAWRKNPMQDLIHDYVKDLNTLRDSFHDELKTTAEELSKAIGNYARRGETALDTFLEKARARSIEFEAAAEARLNQFRGLPAGPPNVADARIAAAAERALADGLPVENEGDRKAQSGRTMTLVKSG